jgi:lysine-N-methylase
MMRAEMNVMLRVPDYFDRFECLADRCPQNCCVGWEVVVDDATAAYFQIVPGEFGDRLRAGLTREDGERCFVRKNRRCPFLDAQGLCEVHMTLGPEHTSATCRTHPRFTEEYGALRETSLSASCAAAAALLLGSREPLTFVTREDGAPQEPWSDEWVPLLLPCRERAIAIAQDRTRPLRQRMAWLLLFSNEVQALLDEDDAAELPTLAEDYAALPECLPPELTAAGEGIFPHALKVLGGLEILEEDWLPLLRAAEAPAPALPDWAGERILTYFLFRYFLKAVDDGDLLSKVQLALFGTLCAERLAGQTATAEEALRRFCREIEHSEENLAAMRDAFCTDEGLSLSAFFHELAAEKLQNPNLHAKSGK